MTDRTALVVTSIAGPNEILKSLADGAEASGWPFYLIGDVSSPADFRLQGVRFLSVKDQLDTGFATAGACPLRHYARKNIGYLLAMREGASAIVETDDDNRPRAAFWLPRTFSQTVRVVESSGWTNVYAYFSEAFVWPRGFPLEFVREPPPQFESLLERTLDCPIQQALCDGDPDVDAIYRLMLPAPPPFRKGRSVALASGSWCPFNSQNTSWARDACPLLYLPAYCSFRMTDIWRSFVAQRIAFANNWGVLFEPPTMDQERNRHDLMRDFEQEVPGYLHNVRIQEMLAGLTIRPGSPAMRENLLLCYEALIAAELLDQRELPLLELWLSDLASAMAR